MEDYGYDTNGYAVEATGDNRMSTDAAGYTYTYDEEGNRLAKFVDTDEDGELDVNETDATVYTWDYRNRLANVTHYATYGGEADLVVDYAYDAFNRLVKETVTDASIHQTIFAYDGMNVVLQFEKADTGDLAAAIQLV